MISINEDEYKNQAIYRVWNLKSN